MSDTQANAGAESSATSIETTESQPLESSNGTQVEKSDDWAEAFEAYNDPEAFADDVEKKAGPVEKAPEQEKPKSHLEQGQPNDLLKLDDLKVPHKYKGAVQERLQKVTSEYEGKIQASEQKLGQYQESNAGLIEAFKTIATNPEQIPDLVIQYGAQIGVPQETIQRYQQFQQNRAQKTNQGENQEKQTPQNVQSVLEQYNQKLRTTQDPDEFISILNARDVALADFLNGQVMKQFEQKLGGYHDEKVKPTLDTLEKKREIENFEMRKSTWKSAKEKLANKEEYKADFAKYEKPIAERLKKDPRRIMLNREPEAARQAGITHEGLIEEAYLILSRNEHIESLKKPKPKFTGLEPNPKHITTQKAGGGDWDDPYHKEIWGIS